MRLRGTPTQNGVSKTLRCWRGLALSVRWMIPVIARAEELEFAGYGAFDSLHLACAEASGADVLLTTDDAFVRRAARGDGSPRLPVRNPLSWVQDELP